MRKLFLLIFLAFSLVGCGSSYKASTQVAEGAFLQLSGDFWNTTLKIDGQTSMEISEDSVESFDIGDKEVVRFDLTPGTHLVEILRGGKVVVKRKIYVSNGNVFEVNVR
ncbi:hypothetical protein [Parashewanella tropica]|uniref:hypothetical protein n=1 Tax=Parashewanella tropica TaxID=2547970 RepID=UPI0010594A3F|nr:hypothetical protein [Parashewanella tropica]